MAVVEFMTLWEEYMRGLEETWPTMFVSFTLTFSSFVLTFDNEEQGAWLAEDECERGKYDWTLWNADETHMYTPESPEEFAEFTFGIEKTDHATIYMRYTPMGKNKEVVWESDGAFAEVVTSAMRTLTNGD
jgi:hypothetical protein